jgi:hypothetical protein
MAAISSMKLNHAAADAVHQRFFFGISPNSLALRSTSSTLPDRHRNSAASSIERPCSIVALRSSISISVQVGAVVNVHRDVAHQPIV